MDPAAKGALKRSVQQLFEQRSDRVRVLNRHYRVLHVELESLRARIQAYVASVKAQGGQRPTVNPLQP